MVQATVDNPAVSIALGGGESTSVPSGEVWRVTISISNQAEVEINSVHVNPGNSGSGEVNTNSFETTLTGGDTITEIGNSGMGLHIGGFVVS